MGLRVCFLVVLVTVLLTLQVNNVKTADKDSNADNESWFSLGKGFISKWWSSISSIISPGSTSNIPIVEVNLKVSDIGRDSVNLTWNEAAGNLTCNDKIYMNSIDMNNKNFMNISLETGISYNCSIMSVAKDLRNNCVKFTPGAGVVKEFPHHNKVIAHFVGDKNSTRLSCTVMNEDVQTDTVWSVTYKGSEQIQRIQNHTLFQISGDRRQSRSEFNFTYENHLNITNCSAKELDGAIIFCGSYLNLFQVNVTFFVCDEPSVMSERTINVWEGHGNCSIDIMTSNLTASKVELRKDGRMTRRNISVNGFSITFDEVRKEDAGNYSVEFCIPCHEDSSPKCFNDTFYLNVMYGPTMLEGTTNYSFSKGEQTDLIIGANLESNPEAVVTWTTPQGETLKHRDKRYTINSAPKLVQLSISDVSEKDNGTWTVTVEVLSTETFKNCSDQNSSSRKKEYVIQVIVVVPPSEPQNVYVEEINTTAVLVRWEEPSEHGSPYLTGYRLCYNITCTPLIQSVSTEVPLIQGEIYNISVFALSTSDKTTGKSHPGSIMFTMDYVHNLEITDIGYDWVYISWDKLDSQYYNISYTCSDSSLSFTTMETSYNFSDLPTNVQVKCSVVAISSDNTPCSLYSSIVASPGTGIVSEFSNHNKVIAHFVGDKNSTRLSCTVMNGDVQTDTVWSVTYKGSEQIQRIQDNNLFKISGDIRQSSLDSNFLNYGNYLEIIDCSVKELDGAVISCGSYVNPSQVDVSRVIVCDEPIVMSESIINVWEGHDSCSIDIMTSNLKASKFELLKDGHSRDDISVNGFSVTFNELREKDAGNYFAEFCIPCHKDSSPKCFNDTFYLNVMYGPTMSEVQTKYSFSKGDQADLIIGENLESNPEAVVTWTTPQGVTLKNSDGRYTMSSGPEKVQLSISGVSERDNGTWTVTVEVMSTETFKNCSDQNSSSIKEFHIQLIVVDPPSEPRNLTVEEIDNSKLLVRWEEPLNHGSPYLFGYELCYNSTCKQTTTTNGTKLSLDRGKLYNISVYAISKSDNITRKSPPTSRMFTMDYVHDFKVADIGHNWVYLSWDKPNPSCGTLSQHYNISCTPRGETPLSFTTMETFYNISELSTSVSISCSVVAISSDDTICSLYSPHINATPGAGIVSEFSDYNRVIAHFVGDKNSSRLSCTVMNEDVQTDTVWSVTYKGSEQIQIIHNDELFKVSGDRRQSSSESNFNYRNYLEIIDCSMKELDGAVISCGSYVSPSQVDVSMLFVCDKPSVMSESIINVWEGHIGCSIDVMATDLNARSFSLLKDKQNTRGGISVNGFSVAFDKIKKEDTGNYFAEFCIPCHKDSSPICFNHTFYLNVMHGPTMSEVKTKYLFSGGDQADLVIGENLESNPEAVVTWTTPQGVTFKYSNGRYTMSSGPDKVQLSISGVNKSDNGTWTVTVEVLSTESFKNCSDQNSSSRRKEFHIQVIVVVPPSKPWYIDVEQLNTTTVSVSWTEPSSRGSPHLTGYRLCYNNTCITTLDSNAFNGVEVNLFEGKLYVITVYAISKSDNITRESHPATKMFTMGAKTASNQSLYYMIGIGITTVIIYGMYMRRTSKRSKPGRPKPSQVLEDSVELIWEQPDATANSFAIFYHSEHDPVGQWNRQDTNITEARIEGLSANTTYTFKVCALLKRKPGPESDLSEPITTLSAPQSTKDIVIAKPYASEVTHNCITLVWDTTENVNDDEVYTYTVLYRRFEEHIEYWKEVPEATQLNSSNVKGLKPQTKYVFKIRADSGGDWSTESDVSDPIETRESEKSELHPKRTLAQYLKSHSQQLYSEDTQPNTFCPITTRFEGEINKCIVNANPNVSTNEFEIPIGEKVLMLVGATGAGKSSLINGITNYIMRVEWKDDFRFKVVVDEDKTSQAFSQTTKITTYSFQGSNLPYTLTVIDTPGFGDTRGMDRDKTIVEQIQSLFSHSGSTAFDQIHGIGFVVQASSPRLTHTQRYVFDSVLSVFGKDIESNIFLLITFADGQEPPVLSAINTAGIPHQGYFQFNNSALYAEASGTVNEMFWNLGRISFERFFAEFEKAEPRSLLLTRENLHERQKLEAIVEGLKLQIQVGLSKINILRQKQRILRKRETEILQNQHFTYELTVTKQRKIDVPSSAFVTNCLQCNFTCHYPCPVARNEEKYRCKAMDGGGPDSANCTVCPGNCHWSQHTNASFRYELYYEVEVQTSDDLKKNLSDALEGKSQIEAMINDIERELDMLQRAIVGMVKEAKQSLERLQEIALKPNPLSETEYIDLLIKNEKHEKSPGYTERIKAFEVIKTMVQEQGVVGGEKKIKSSWWKQIMD